jgi:hypothetical protein
LRETTRTATTTIVSTSGTATNRCEQVFACAWGSERAGCRENTLLWKAATAVEKLRNTIHSSIIENLKTMFKENS